MFIVLLRFGENRAAAPRFMEGHRAWLDQGHAEGVFLLSGTLQPATGGAILAHGLSRAALDDRLRLDPFIAEGVVTTDIIAITPGRADARLAFLAG
ncbi:YciI family protein [Roseomonas sp. F4]